LDLSEVSSHPDIDRLLADMKRKDLPAIAGDMGNILETVTIPLHPEITKIKQCMCKYGALNAMMSGSGPTVFGLYEKTEDAKKAADKITELGLAKQVYVTDIYNNRR
jgi:4-diphosphocytidyl-2-C-methyl-D-erythritol kinase